jgi:hypothetical protein
MPFEIRSDSNPERIKVKIEVEIKSIREKMEAKKKRRTTVKKR